MLDNVIDINYYSVPQARTSNMRHRPVGLGIMGFQDALYKLRIPSSSDAAVEFADHAAFLIAEAELTEVDTSGMGAEAIRALAEAQLRLSQKAS